MLTLKGQLTGTLTAQSHLSGRLAVAQGMSGILSPRLNASHYHGSYEFVPGDTDTTVHTSGQILSDDIVIKAIPSNYGKITWTGSAIIVT